jgi:hypothetical protein
MKQLWLPLFAALAALAQQPGSLDPSPPPIRSSRPGLKRRQIDAISKQDFKDNTRDVAKILDLAQGLQSSLARNGSFIVDANDIRSSEQIEKLAKDIRGRLKRF